MIKNLISMSIIILIGLKLTACASVPSLVDKKYRYYDPCPTIYCAEYSNWSNNCKKEVNIQNYSQVYCFEYCSEKSIFGNCQKYEMDIIEPNNPEIRSMGFRLRIPEK